MRWTSRTLDGTACTPQTPLMSAVLSLSGCGPRLEIGLRVEDETAVSSVALGGRKPRNELIVAALDLLLRGSNLAPSDVSGIAATRGPGSFTGLRVTLATAQALALAHGLACHGFPSLLVQAARTGEPEVLALQPARRGVVYAEHYARSGADVRSVRAPELLSIESLCERGLPVIAPDGLALPVGTRRATALLTAPEALMTLYDRLPATDPSTLVPLYLEPPSATPPRRIRAPWQPSQKES